MRESSHFRICEWSSGMENRTIFADSLQNHEATEEKRKTYREETHLQSLLITHTVSLMN